MFEPNGIESTDLKWIRTIVYMQIKSFRLRNVNRDDLMSAGMEGYCKALKSFDPNKNVPFRAYCVHRIQGSAMDELRKQIGDERLKNKWPIVYTNYNFDELMSESSEYKAILEDNASKGEEEEEKEYEKDFKAWVKEAGLSDREREIVLLKLQGLTHEKIGAHYGHSAFWSCHHLKKICVKLKAIYNSRGKT